MLCAPERVNIFLKYAKLGVQIFPEELEKSFLTINEEFFTLIVNFQRFIRLVGISMATFSTKEFRQGKAIVRQGTHGTSAFIIQKGKVEVTQEVDGKTLRICELTVNDIFGEMALISEKPRTATVRALTECEVAILTKETFMKLPDTNPAVLRVKKIMLERLQGKKG